MQNQALEQVIISLQSANNVLVTVKNSPTLDELAAAVGLTLALNKMDKHATTVFSGSVPSTLEFLQPESVIEATTDSLRDFIISLDKSKADKLRYKVEDNVVRIFITPYKSSITSEDLEFTQGDFNVDVVVALGVVEQQDFDTAVTAHGRILHDATVIGITKQNVVSQVGSLNWGEPQASSVCEMVSNVVMSLNPQLLDGQMATSFLTGIVAETDRFKNEQTTSAVLSLSSQLMNAGANQQLIAEKLEEPAHEQAQADPLDAFAAVEPSEAENDDGSLAITHDEGEKDPVYAPRDEVDLALSTNTAATETTNSLLSKMSDDNELTAISTGSSNEEVLNSLAPKPGVNEENDGDRVQEESQDLSHGKKSETASEKSQRHKLEPVSEDMKKKPIKNPISEMAATKTEKTEETNAKEEPNEDTKAEDNLVDVRRNVASIAQPQVKPLQSIGAQHVDLKETVEPPKITHERPKLLNEIEDSVRENESKPPEVPPPLMPPPEAQPHFYDAEGNKTDPLAAK